MKNAILTLALGLCIGTTTYSQIKIGENPQNLDAASVLELESTSRVLVITRVTTAQMLAITPLRGAIVYNTDTQCIHLYTGTEWFNPCDRPDEQTFTADPIVNPDPTIVITEDAVTSNFNFEVGMINGIRNIVPSTVSGDLHIIPNSITSLQLGNDSVTLDKLADGVIDGQLIQWDGTEWVLIEETAITVTEVDGIVGNEIRNVVDATLIRSGSGTDADPFLIDVNAQGIDTAELADNAVTTDKILDGEVNTADVADDAITNVKMDDNSVGTNEIIDDSVTLTKIGTLGAADANRVLTTDVTGDPLWEDRANFTSSSLGSAQILVGSAAGIASAVNLTGDATISSGGVLDLAANAVETDEIMDDAVTTVKILDANVTNTKLDKANIPLSGFQAATANVDMGGFQINNVQDPTVAQDAATKNYVDNAVGGVNSLSNGQILVGDVTNTAQEVNISGDATIDNTGALDLATNAVENDEIIDNAVTVAKIGTLGAADANTILTTDGAGDPQWEDRTNFATSTLNDGLVFVGSAANVATGVAISGDATIDNTGALTISNNAITTAKILNENVTPAKIQPSATNRQVLTTIGGAATWQSPYHAIAKANGSTLTNSNGVTSITPLGVGNYQVNFSSNASSADYVIQLTLLNAGVNATIEVVNQANTGFTVQISDFNGASIDSEWYFTVIDF